MMGFGPSEAKQLTYWEYTAMLTVYNDRHADPDKVDAPDAITFDESMARIASNPALLN